MSCNLVLLVFSATSTSVVSKTFQCPLSTALPSSKVLRVESSSPGSSVATQTTTIIGSVTSDLRLGHKIYHHVAFQSLYTTSLETSSFDHPCITMCWSKFRQNLPCVSCATEVVSILLLPPGLLHTLHQVHVPYEPSLLLTCATRLICQTADIIGHISHS